MAMVVGFLFSRILLSVSTIVFAIVALGTVPIKKWPFNTYALLGCLWVFILVVSRLWSDDVDSWTRLISSKIPILFMSMAFGILPAFTLKQKQTFTTVLMLMFSIGMAYTLYFYWQDKAWWQQQYGVSHMLPTLVYNDHIRFSVALALVVNWCFYYLFQYAQRKQYAFLIGFIIASVVYLHLLAARSGIVSLYLTLMVWTFFIVLKLSWQKAVILLFFIIGALVFSYNSMPTLRNKIGYTIYSYQQLKETGIDENYSDMGRLLSYKVGLELIKTHPMVGVGYGDVPHECTKQYQQLAGKSKVRTLLPHNEFIVVGAAAGLLTMLICVVWALWPLFKVKNSKAGVHLIVVCLVLFFVLNIEPWLEIQMGVFVYLLFLLWAMKENNPYDLHGRKTF